MSGWTSCSRGSWCADPVRTSWPSRIIEDVGGDADPARVGSPEKPSTPWSARQTQVWSMKTWLLLTWSAMSAPTCGPEDARIGPPEGDAVRNVVDARREQQVHATGELAVDCLHRNRTALRRRSR